MKSLKFRVNLRGLIALVFILVTIWPVEVRAQEELPDKAYVKGVPGHPQSYSLSCESRSAVDWAAYWGVEISERKFLRKLPRSDNPNTGFVGQPDDPLGQIPPASYGVHAAPVAELLRDYGLPAVAHTGLQWKRLKAEIAAGRPVIVWVIGQMWSGTPVEYTTSDGETLQVAAYEHTMILVGYTPDFVYAIDPVTGKESSYPLRTFLNSWKVLGRMAVMAEEEESAAEQDQLSEAADIEELPEPILEEALPQPTETILAPVPTLEQPSVEPAQVEAKFYKVKRGDYLTAIARRFGINWKALANLNNLSPPYVLHPGQKLRIR